MRTRTQRIVFVVILGGAVAAGLVVLAVFLAKGANTTDTSKVVVAKVDIAAGTAITSDNVDLEDRNNGDLPATTVRNTSDAVGKTVAVNLSAHAIVTTDDLTTSAFGAVVPRPLLHDGNVAVALPYSAAKAAGGYITTNDHIDIVVDTTGNLNLHYAFQDVPVLRVGTVSQDPSAATSIVVEVPRGEAESLLYATTATGPGKPVVIAYVIRPLTQKGDLDTTPYTQKPGLSDPAFGPGNWTSLFSH